jgi:hypothetical protein
MLTRVGAVPAIERRSVMQQEALDYRRPSTPMQRRPVLRMIVLAAASVLLVVSVIWCVATWASPGRFIFLPGGDVGLGFRSHAGWLEWIEYAPWMSNPDYVQWSVPWVAAFVAEGLVISLCLYRRRRPAAAYAEIAADRAGSRSF